MTDTSLGLGRAALAVLTLVAALAVVGVSSGSTRSSTSRILVPAYFDPPSAKWTKALSAPDRTILIVNPDSGPGTSADPAYKHLITRARAAGHEMIGYVHTSYGSRPTATVERDIRRWATFYGVRDIFFDEVSQKAARLPHYRTITAYAHTHGARLLVVNPGTVPAQGYFTLGAIVVTFEGTYAAYRQTRFPNWLRHEPASQQANIVYAVPNAADARSTLSAMRAHGVGVGYATGEGGDNPYAGLPPYYDHETGWLAK